LAGAKAELYTQLLQDRLNEYSYPALLAGAGIVVDANNRGIDITVQGFHDRLYKLMDVLIDEIELATFDPKRFEQLKLDTLRNWRNNAKKTPYHQLYNQLAVGLYSPYWSDSEKINALEMVSLKELHVFAKNWRKGALVKSLFYGNLSREWMNDWDPLLKRLVDSEKGVPISPVKVAKLTNDPFLSTSTELENNSTVAQYDFRVVDHTDQAVMLYVQGVDDSLESQAAMMVLRQLLQSPFYSSLRTEQQLGYIVFLGSLQLKEVPGSVFVVQSPTVSVYKQAVITQLLEEPTSLSASANDYWANLLRGDIKLDRRQALANAVEGLNSKQLKDTYRESIQNASKSIWIYSREPKSIKGQVRYALPTTAYSYP